jgi:hypothetical protein
MKKGMLPLCEVSDQGWRLKMFEPLAEGYKA